MQVAIPANTARDGRMWAGTTITIVVLALFLGSCSAVPVNNSVMAEKEAAAIKQAMKRQDEIIFLSSPEIDTHKPVLLLLHGATGDPTEMIGIFHEWRDSYNVLLFAYNWHKPIETVAANLVVRLKMLRAKMESLPVANTPAQDMTIITYSYSASILRKAVLLAESPTLFSDVSLIQLVPTAGGSYLARGMKNPVIAFLVEIFSKPSAVENPYGRIATELWGDEGHRKFCETINPGRVRTILIEGDRHSVANLRNEEITKRYHNGIGTNVVMISKFVGASHEYFPFEPPALEYLRRCLQTARDAAPAAQEGELLIEH